MISSSGYTNSCVRTQHQYHKTLIVSKIGHLSLILMVPKYTAEMLQALFAPHNPDKISPPTQHGTTTAQQAEINRIHEKM